eukprot:TRINITY_DN60220_c0_g1_i1.p1 TRINITY_DN60220_c0_g1~~TRINITY_DN60220_c0_g1_i1.p1  ORF type:complete len:382 (+),score=97.29 TRINITY_DN60220_c0_g1_i1:84-1229(+)
MAPRLPWSPGGANQTSFPYTAQLGDDRATLHFDTTDAACATFGVRHGSIVRFTRGRWSGVPAAVLGVHDGCLWVLLDGESAVRDLKHCRDARDVEREHGMTIVGTGGSDAGAQGLWRRASSRAGGRAAGASDFMKQVQPWSDEHRNDSNIRVAALCFHDGLLANISLMTGVMVCSYSVGSVLMGGMLGLLAGAATMGAAEWVGTSLGNEMEERELDRERHHLRDHPEDEVENLNRLLAEFFSARTIELINRDTRGSSTQQLDKQLKLHGLLEFGLDPDLPQQRPLGAAAWAATAFGVGALIPLVPLFSWFHQPLASAMMLSYLIAFALIVMMAVWTSRVSTIPLLHAVGQQLSIAALSVGATAAAAWAARTYLLPHLESWH